MRRWITRPVAVLGLAALLLLGAAAAMGGTSRPDAPASAAPVEVDVSGSVPTGDLDGAVASVQDRLRRLPGDWQAWASVGALYVQQAAVTADPGYYDKADQAFARSLQERPERNDVALTGQAALAAAQHDFEGARLLAERAVAINAYSSSALGILTDALVELGRYDEAFATLQRMLDLRPGVPSYTRASYSFELRGDIPAARQALETALGIAADPSDAAFAHRYLGELAWSTGDLDEAERQYTAGLRVAPSSAPLLVGKARVAAARGEVESALRDYSDAVRRLPEPSYLAELGDLYASLGRTDEAEAQYDVVRAVERLFVDSGSDLDLEQSVFAADHGDPEGALRSASAGWEERRSVHMADAYAWALHVNGRSQEALEIAVQAQRLGTRNALFDYHRGMIQKALGDHEAARRSLTSALTLNPHFSTLHAPTARAALDELGGPL